MGPKKKKGARSFWGKNLKKHKNWCHLANETGTKLNKNKIFL